MRDNIISLSVHQAARGMKYEPAAAPERPLTSRARLAAMFGVCPKTVDRWVGRDGMPQEKDGNRGCWLMVGAQRRYYPDRVQDWLNSWHEASNTGNAASGRGF